MQSDRSAGDVPNQCRRRHRERLDLLLAMRLSNLLAKHDASISSWLLVLPHIGDDAYLVERGALFSSCLLHCMHARVAPQITFDVINTHMRALIYNVTGNPSAMRLILRPMLAELGMQLHDYLYPLTQVRDTQARKGNGIRTHKLNIDIRTR